MVPTQAIHLDEDPPGDRHDEHYVPEPPPAGPAQTGRDRAEAADRVGLTRAQKPRTGVRHDEHYVLDILLRTLHEVLAVLTVRGQPIRDSADTERALPGDSVRRGGQLPGAR